MGSQDVPQREALAPMDNEKEGKVECVPVKWGGEPGNHQDPLAHQGLVWGSSGVAQGLKPWQVTVKQVPQRKMQWRRDQ